MHHVIGIGDVHARAEHVVAADLDSPARVNHDVAVEVVMFPDLNRPGGTGRKF